MQDCAQREKGSTPDLGTCGSDILCARLQSRHCPETTRQTLLKCGRLMLHQDPHHRQQFHSKAVQVRHSLGPEFGRSGMHQTRQIATTASNSFQPSGLRANQIGNGNHVAIRTKVSLPRNRFTTFMPHLRHAPIAMTSRPRLQASCGSQTAHAGCSLLHHCSCSQLSGVFAPLGFYSLGRS